MSIFSRWVLPVAFMGIGIAILTGLILRELPENTGLRPILGIVVILMGIHRFAASRSYRPQDRRPYGGERHKPWEDEK